jgi:hypothetical protein
MRTSLLFFAATLLTACLAAARAGDPRIPENGIPTPFPDHEGNVQQAPESNAVRIQSGETHSTKTPVNRSSGDEVVKMKGTVSNNTERYSNPGTLSGDDVRESGLHVGRWKRKALFVDGAPQAADPDTLFLGSDGRFTSIAPRCSAAGNYQTSEGVLTMHLLQTDCPGGIVQPVTVYTMTFSEDTVTMTLVTGPVREIFSRAE